MPSQVKVYMSFQSAVCTRLVAKVAFILLILAIGGYFVNFSSSAGSISEEIYSQQVVYLSCTSVAGIT